MRSSPRVEFLRWCLMSQRHVVGGASVNLTYLERVLSETITRCDRAYATYNSMEAFMAYKKMEWVDVALSDSDYEDILDLSNHPQEMLSLYIDGTCRGYKVSCVYDSKAQEMRVSVMGVASEVNKDKGVSARGTHPTRVLACALFKAFCKHEWGSWVNADKRSRMGFS